MINSQFRPDTQYTVQRSHATLAMVDGPVNTPLLLCQPSILQDNSKQITNFDFRSQDERSTSVCEFGHAESVSYRAFTKRYQDGQHLLMNLVILSMKNQLYVESGKDYNAFTTADMSSYVQRIETALEWIADHADEYNITPVNLSFVDGREHTKPLGSTPKLTSVLQILRQKGIWVNSPTWNHCKVCNTVGDSFFKCKDLNTNCKNGIGFPAIEKNVVAVGCVVERRKGGRLSVFGSRHPKVGMLLAKGKWTSSCSAAVARGAFLLREILDQRGPVEKSQVVKRIHNALIGTGRPVWDTSTHVYNAIDVRRAIQKLSS